MSYILDTVKFGRSSSGSGFCLFTPYRPLGASGDTMQSMFSGSYDNIPGSSLYSAILPKTAIFTPIRPTPAPFFYRCHAACTDFATQNIQNPFHLRALAAKIRLWLKVTIGALLVLPIQSLTSTYDLSSLDKISLTKTLTVAITEDELFTNNAHQHSFGYDVARRYADHLGANLQVVRFLDIQNAVAALKSDQVDLFISNKNTHTDGLNSLSTQCGNNQSVSTQLFAPTQNSALLTHAQSYLCSKEGVSDTQAMSKFYKPQVLDSYSVAHFNQTIQKRLPLYKSTFEQVAKKFNHDWEVLAVISYQESHLNPSAVSRTGVQGLMMLTQDTAKAMGVKDRTDARQSIYGGAKYLNQLNQDFDNIPESDRLWFVLAAYNMGPNAVKNIQKTIQKQGGNPQLWSEFYGYLSKNAHKNSRFVQCMHYVTNIRSYLETLKA